MTLDELHIGQTAMVTAVGGDGALRQHFLDMGLTPGTDVTLVKYAPLGDPMQLRIRNYELTLRRADASHIQALPDPPLKGGGTISGVQATLPPFKGGQGRAIKVHDIPHPRIGEERDPRHQHHPQEHRADGQAVENATRTITFALVGNQNCGKTTLFNQLTGANQHVGNFPGVTVDRKDGAIKGHPHTVVTDLPGIYSLSPYTQEEVVSREFILKNRPSGIINIIDATNIERSLYLTMQLMELDTPMVLALNMMDEVEGNGGTIRINRMEKMLGIPVIPISAMKNEGVDELVEHALHVAEHAERPGRLDFCSPEDHGGSVHRCLHAIMHLIEDHALRASIPPRFAAGKVVEGDELLLDALQLTDNEHQTVEHILQQMEEERGLDCRAAMADMRYSFIDRLCEQTVVRPHQSREHLRSLRIDRILTGRWTALPTFFALMGLIFYLTFNSLGAWMQQMVEAGIEQLTAYVDALLVQADIAPPVHSLVIDGVFSGVGTVVSFLPLILLLFIFLSLLEDSGYMARIAFVMDKLLRRIGLSGRSIVPLLIGFGCSVPSIMASRTLPSQRDRKLTILLTPFMSCTAKIPIYAFFVATFFPGRGAWVMMMLYVVGICVGICVALVGKHTLFRGEPVPFVMELPNYRMPAVSNVLRLLWDKARDFLVRAFTVIFLASIVIWFMKTFDGHLQMVENSQDSLLARLSGLIAPLFQPLGFGDWRFVTALISGFMAKESVVSTLGTLLDGVSLTSLLSTAGSLSMLVFCLLYTPCVAAISTIRHELGGRWAWGIVLLQCAIAWLCAFLVYQVACL